MRNNVLFIHGAGEGAYEEDQLLAASLQNALGSAYAIHYEDWSATEAKVIGTVFWVLGIYVGCFPRQTAQLVVRFPRDDLHPFPPPKLLTPHPAAGEAFAQSSRIRWRRDRAAR